MMIPDELIKALHNRGALPHEIAELTFCPMPFVKEALGKIDSSDGGSHESEVVILSFPPKNKSLESKEAKSLDIAQRIIVEDLLGEDLSVWNSMIELYNKHKRNLPERFSDRLRLEAFLRGTRSAKSGEHSLLNRLMEIESTVVFFPEVNLEKEKDFIGSNLVEDPVGVNRDRIGYFRVDEDGRWREPVASGADGGIIMDSPNEALQREISRNNNAGKEKK